MSSTHVVSRQNLFSCLESHELMETSGKLKNTCFRQTSTTGAKQSSTFMYDDLTDQYSSSFSRRLSAKSLELCTENLGSETGSDDNTTMTMDSSSILWSPGPPSFHELPASNSIQSLISSSDEVVLQNPKHHVLKSEIRKSSIDFLPPPLTSMRCLQMRRRREGERLIIEAVEGRHPQFRNCYMQAERSDGRLRLSFFTTASELFQIESKKEDDCIEEEENVNDETAPIEIESKKEELIDDGEMGMEKFQRLSRCKEGHLLLLCSSDNNWNPALNWPVATS